MERITQNLEGIQSELEHKAMAMGIDRYNDALTIRGQADTKVGLRLFTLNVEPLAKAIDAWRNPERTARRKNRVAVILEGIDSQSLAVLAIRATLQSINSNTTTTGLGRRIGLLVEEHAAWRDVWLNDKGMAVKVTRQLKYTSHEGHRRAVTRHVVRDTLGRAAWPQADCIAVGEVLIELMCDATMLVEKDNLYSARKRRTTSYVRATEATLKFMEDGNARNEVMNPVNSPMVCKPVPWTNTMDGGYIHHRRRVVKTNNQDYLSELASTEMPEVYRSLNALQDTAYQVNAAVLGVLQQAWQAGDTLAGIPAVNPKPLPARPADIDTNEEALKEWKAAASEVHAENTQMISHRMSFMRVVALAEQYNHYEAIYFPHQLDWRGRAYPIPTDLQPQGDDFSKSLLQLSEAVELGEEGSVWLKIHIAGLFGVDKVSMDDRIAWVDEHHGDILDSAFNPLDGERFWTTADKPWQALAACFDYLGYTIEGPSHKSHLIVGVDGSCNGLQHLSALLRDRTGGAAVNLTPSDKPQDIYSLVLDKTLELMDSSDDDEASDWLSEGVTRKLVKRPVMTKPYGVTNTGMRDQLLHQMGKDGAMIDATKGVRSHMAGYLAGKVDTAIGGIVVASREVMDWMRKTATVAGKAGTPLRWTTPIGLPVLQDYRTMKSSYACVYVGGAKVKYRVSNETEKVDTRKQAAGLSPNVVHSLDEGINAFAMVHDSYGTHAGNIGALNIILREAFVEMYSADLLGDLHAQFVAQVDESIAKDIPELPPYGDLEISEVLESMYFFA